MTMRAFGFVRKLAALCLLAGSMVLAPSLSWAQGSGSKLMSDGEASLSSGQYDAAIDQLSKAIKSGSLAKPDMAKAFISRGQALQGKGSHARAVADFTNALWLESLSGSDTARAFALRGKSRQTLGQAKSAADDFKKAEASQPGISAQVGASGVAAGSSGTRRTASRSSGSSSGGDEGFFGSLFGGSSNETTTTQRTASRGASGTRVRTTRREAAAPASQTRSSGSVFGDLFGSDDEAPTPAPTARRVTSNSQTTSPATPGSPRRLVASQPAGRMPIIQSEGSGQVKTQQLSPTSGGSGNVNRPGVLADILPGETGPQRKPGTQVAARTPAPIVRRAPVKEEEPGFFERIFSSSSDEPARSTSSRNTSTRVTTTNQAAKSEGPRRLATRSDGPQQPRTATIARAPAPAPQPVSRVQKDNRLPTFVNQPRLTDRILANDAVEPGGQAGNLTRLASAPASSRNRVQPTAVTARQQQVAVEPAQLDWNQTTRVERGPVANPVPANRPRVVAPSRSPTQIARAQRVQAPQPAPVIRRPTAAANAPAPQPVTRVARAPAPQTESRTLGSRVRSAVNWVEDAFTTSPGTTTTRTQPNNRTAAAQPAARPQTARTQTTRTQTARTSYRRPAAKRAAKPAARASSGGGGYVVQLAARQRRSDAEAAIRKVRSRHGAVLGGAQPYIVKAVIPGKGTYYRVRVGPYRSKAQVSSVCSQLKGRGQDCFTTR